MIKELMHDPIFLAGKVGDCNKRRYSSRTPFPVNQYGSILPHPATAVKKKPPRP